MREIYRALDPTRTGGEGLLTRFLTTLYSSWRGGPSLCICGSEFRLFFLTDLTTQAYNLSAMETPHANWLLFAREVVNESRPQLVAQAWYLYHGTNPPRTTR